MTQLPQSRWQRTGNITKTAHLYQGASLSYRKQDLKGSTHGYFPHLYVKNLLKQIYL
jgi:hypothetical protein